MCLFVLLLLKGWFAYTVVSGGATIRFIGIDSEIYYADYSPQKFEKQRAQGLTNLTLSEWQERRKVNLNMLQRQWEFVRNEVMNSAQYDWVIAYAHRPMYCSNGQSVCIDDN